MTTNKLKRPCAVNIRGLSKKKAIKLRDMFLRDGVNLVDDVETMIPSYFYYGIDWDNDIQLYDHEEYFSREDEEGTVTIYTYDEVVSLMNCNDDTAISDVQATKVRLELDNASEGNTDGFKVICNKTYTIIIKGQEFVLTEAEYVELEEAMRLVDE